MLGIRREIRKTKLDREEKGNVNPIAGNIIRIARAIDRLELIERKQL